METIKEEKKAELEQRVAELERLVWELVQRKEDRIITVLGKDWKPIGESLHDYKVSWRKAEEKD